MSERVCETPREFIPWVPLNGNMAKDLAIILNNGTVNSAVVTALAAQKYRPVMVHIEQAPATASRARAAYDQQVAHFKPYREHSISLATSAHPTPEKKASAADQRQATPLAPRLQELLPMLALAAGFGAAYHASAIYLGLRVGPDGDDLAQATEFGQIWNELLQLPCALPELEITMPLLELEPWQVIDLGFQVAAPFEKTWSCVEEAGEPCWACVGCRAREQAFERTGRPDPLRVVRKV